MLQTLSKGGAPSGGGPTQIPPPQTIDGPAGFVFNASAAGLAASWVDVDFLALKNTVSRTV